MGKKISFVSSKNRGITLDMLVVKDFFRVNDEKVEFKDAVANENAKNSLVKKGNISIRKEYCKNNTDIICVDGSIAGKLPKNAPEGKRVLIATPYDYQFKAINEHDKGAFKKKNTYKNFTHIIVGSPFEKELLKKCYNTPKSEIIDQVCLPYSWRLNQEEFKKKHYGKYCKHYPMLKGKKILAILLTGELDEDEENPYAEVNWNKIFDNLDDDWIIFTNSGKLLENMTHIGYEHRNQFVYSNRTFDTREVLSFADCLVTNSGLYATYFAVRQKPIYCLKYTNCQFEKYMKRKFSNLYIKNVEDIDMTKFSEFTSENEKFCEYFSYDCGENPSAKISEIFE